MVETSAPLEELLCEISLDSGLEQLVENPTRGSNTLDLVFTNSNSLLGDVEVVDSIPGTVHFSLSRKNPLLLLTVEEWCTTIRRQIMLSFALY